MKSSQKLIISITLLISSLSANGLEAKPLETSVSVDASHEQTPKAEGTTASLTSSEQPSSSDEDNNNDSQQRDELAKLATSSANSHNYYQVDPFMQLTKLSPTSNNITCNDGSQVGYYKRLNSHSKSWIIYLQGGGFCNSEESCQQRWQTSPHLMSSNFWPQTKSVEGILSSEPKENPYSWNANHIYIPYCSSDSWSGLSRSSRPSSGASNEQPNSSDNIDFKAQSSFHFMGSKIIDRVLESLYEDLPHESSLYAAKFILMAGDSAGATGVILNLDRVNGIVQRRTRSMRQSCEPSLVVESQLVACEPKQAPVLRGLADSGWFLDNEPYDYGMGGDFYGPESMQQEPAQLVGGCSNGQRCTPSQSIRQAKLLWNGQVPRACAQQYPSEPWRCYFGYRAYQTLKTPLFVVQWLYDEAQLMVDNIARPDTNGQWEYVNKVVREMRVSLENVTALFAPSCFSHSLVIRKTWNQININGLKLPHVLNSWEEQSLLSKPAIESKQQQHSPQFGQVIEEIRESDALKSQQNISTPLISGIINQPSFDTFLVQQDAPDQQHQSLPVAVSTRTPSDRHDLRHALPHRTVGGSSSSGTPNGTARSRATRKRKRNNQQQRGSHKQNRQKIPNESSQIPMTTTMRESNDLSSSTNPLLDLLPLIDRSVPSSDPLFGRLNSRSESTNSANSLIGASGRSGRSTIVDDATIMLNNNVPDDSALQFTHNFEHGLDKRRHSTRTQMSHQPSTIVFNTRSFISHSTKHPNADRFRLIDSCGWPQCNTECPLIESDLNLGRLTIQLF